MNTEIVNRVKVQIMRSLKLFFFGAGGDDKQNRQSGTVESTNALDISAIADSKEKCIEKVYQK